MPLHDNVFACRSAFAEQGLHSGDLLMEIREATLAAGTVEVPTIFKDGNIVALFAFKKNSGAVNAQEAFTSDYVVTAGAVTVAGPTGSTAVVSVIIFGRTDVAP